MDFVLSAKSSPIYSLFEIRVKRICMRMGRTFTLMCVEDCLVLSLLGFNVAHQPPLLSDRSEAKS